jgi:hypothetical protein
LAFVSAPGTSAFMVEILHAVADAVSEHLGEHESVLHHRGFLSEVVDGRTVAVVIPHEYFAADSDASRDVRARTIAFGVEHPGTATFRSARRAASSLGAWYEISERSIGAIRSRPRRQGRARQALAPRHRDHDEKLDKGKAGAATHLAIWGSGHFSLPRSE